MKDPCKECLVKACCEEPCYYLFHPLCAKCKFNKSCKEKCESVILSELEEGKEKRYQVSNNIIKYLEKRRIIKGGTYEKGLAVF